MEAEMATRKLHLRLNLLQVLFRQKTSERSGSKDDQSVKAKQTKDDEWYYENADRKVLIEYYKNLGRGPL